MSHLLSAAYNGSIKVRQVNSAALDYLQYNSLTASLKDYFSIKYRATAAFEKVPSDLSKHTVTVCFYVIVKSFHKVGLFSKKYC